MQCSVDASVFVVDPPSSYGVISGKLDLPSIPSIGDSLSLNPPRTEPNVALPQGAPTELVVERVTDVPDLPVLVGLTDIEIQSRTDAESFVAYVCKGFGLYFDPTDLDDPAH